jgi:hypothetical protein
MKTLTLLLVIILGIVVYIVFDSSSKNDDSYGAIIETYGTYKGGINDAQTAVSAIEARSQLAQ